MRTEIKLSEASSEQLNRITEECPLPEEWVVRKALLQYAEQLDYVEQVDVARITSCGELIPESLHDGGE